MKNWERVTSTHEMLEGKVYRCILTIRLPYTHLIFAGLEKTIRLGVGLRNLNPFEDLHKKIDVTDVYATPPNTNMRTGRNEPWHLIVEFKKRGGNTPILVIGGLIVLVLAIAVSSTKFERLIEKSGETLKETVFNPGFILAAFVLGFMFLRGK